MAITQSLLEDLNLVVDNTGMCPIVARYRNWPVAQRGVRGYCPGPGQSAVRVSLFGTQCRVVADYVVVFNRYIAVGIRLGVDY